MPGDKRNPTEREDQLATISRMYLQGSSQAEIARSLGISQPTVSLDLQEVRSRWRESSIRDFDEARSQELAKIDLVEAEFWAQWEKSKELKRTRKHEEGITEKGDILKQTTIEEQRCGNPAYLNGVMQCVERRCKLLGLDSELKYQDLTLAIGAVVRAGFDVKRIVGDGGSDAEGLDSSRDGSSPREGDPPTDR
jgi:predicted transcriptional regulator